MIKRIWNETNEYVGGDLKQRLFGFTSQYYISIIITSIGMYFIQRNINPNHFAFGKEELLFFLLLAPIVMSIITFCMWYFAARPTFNQKRKDQETKDKWRNLRKSFDDTY